MMENNILLDNIKLKNENIFISNKDVSLIEATGQCEISLFNCNIINLKIIVLDNSSLIINLFNIIDDCDQSFNINIKDNSKLLFNHSFINNHSYKLDIISNFNGNNSKFDLNIYGINDKGNSNISVNGYVKQSTNDNILNENIKMININGGIGSSYPNMYIDTSKVIANHSASISGINDNELFYLMSKGLSKSEASKLICNGFVIQKITNLDLKIKIKELLNRR